MISVNHIINALQHFKVGLPFFDTPCIILWIADFLTNRKQRINLGYDLFSKLENVPDGVPQETKLEPWLLIFY